MTARRAAGFAALVFTLLAPRAARAGELDGLSFRAIGPSLPGGRVTAVAGSDAQPFLYYGGAAGGGVFKSTDGGMSWTPVFADKPVNAVGALALDARDPRIVWVGTGEANPRNDVSLGDGVWSSADGGATWVHRGLAETAAISRILIDPRDRRDVLAGALGDPFRDSPARGVFRTRDGGRTWQKTLYIGPASGVSDIAREPRNPGVVFAGMWQFRREPWAFSSGGPAGGLYRSRDGGTTWRKVRGHGFPALTGRIGLAIAASRPQRIYAVVEAKEGLVFRSDDGGDSWRRMTSDSNVNQRPFYFSRIFVDPRNADHVISLSVYPIESKDGGKTWKRIAPDSQYDYHDLWWAADGRRIMMGNDAGMMVTHDAGASWTRLTNLDISQVYRLGYDTSRLPYRVCVGLQDDDTWCGPSNSLNSTGIMERDWIDVQRGDGGFVWPDRSEPDRIWGTTVLAQSGQVYLFDGRAGQSVDVSPYPRDTSGMAIATLPYRFAWNTPLALSPHETGVAYVGANVVFRSADQGRTWAAISPDLTLDEKAHQQASGGPITRDVTGSEFYDTSLDVAPSPVRAGVLWVGTDDGLVQVTEDGGEHWRNVTPPGLPKYAAVETVEPGRLEGGTAFAVADRHLLGDPAPYIYATSDYGATWRSIAAGLPAGQYAHVVRQDPRNPDVLFAGLEQSLWFSLDRGAHWEPLRLNLPTASVRDLGIPPQSDDLVVGTHGRSVWILDDLAPIEQLAAARAQPIYLFAPPAVAYAYFQYATVLVGDAGAVDANYFVGPNPDVVTLDFYQKHPANVRPSLEIVDAEGRVVRHLAGTQGSGGDAKPVVPNAAGVNRLAWDGAEDPPVPWLSVRPWNRGPDAGAEALPGRYTVRLHAGGTTLERSFELRADPRSPWSLAQLTERHAFLSGLFDQLSAIDVALNALDRAAASSNPQTRSKARAAIARFTSNPQNSEDSVKQPEGVRERLLVLISLLESSLQPPFAAQRQQAGEITALFNQAMDAYRTFSAP